MENTTKPKRIYKKKCNGGQPSCKNCVGDYKNVKGVGYCDKYIDNHPYDPYWEHMNNDFENSKEYEELKKNGLLQDTGVYRDAYERYVQYYES